MSSCLFMVEYSRSEEFRSRTARQASFEYSIHHWPLVFYRIPVEQSGMRAIERIQNFTSIQKGHHVPLQATNRKIIFFLSLFFTLGSSVTISWGLNSAGYSPITTFETENITFTFSLDSKEK